MCQLERFYALGINGLFAVYDRRSEPYRKVSEDLADEQEALALARRENERETDRRRRVPAIA